MEFTFWRNLAIACSIGAALIVGGETTASAQETGAIVGQLVVRGNEGGLTGRIPLAVVPASEADRGVSEEALKQAGLTTDDRGAFRIEGLEPGTYYVGIVLAEAVLESKYDAVLLLQTAQSARALPLPAVRVEVSAGASATVSFVRQPYPTPVPGLIPPAAGNHAGLHASDATARWTFVPGAALVAIGLWAGVVGTVALRRQRTERTKS